MDIESWPSCWWRCPEHRKWAILQEETKLHPNQSYVSWVLLFLALYPNGSSFMLLHEYCYKNIVQECTVLSLSWTPVHYDRHLLNASTTSLLNSYTLASLSSMHSFRTQDTCKLITVTHSGQSEWNPNDDVESMSARRWFINHIGEALFATWDGVLPLQHLLRFFFKSCLSICQTGKHSLQHPLHDTTVNLVVKTSITK